MGKLETRLSYFPTLSLPWVPVTTSTNGEALGLDSTANFNLHLLVKLTRIYVLSDFGHMLSVGTICFENKFCTSKSSEIGGGESGIVTTDPVLGSCLD